MEDKPVWEMYNLPQLAQMNAPQQMSGSEMGQGTLAPLQQGQGLAKGLEKYGDAFTKEGATKLGGALSEAGGYADIAKNAKSGVLSKLLGFII